MCVPVPGVIALVCGWWLTITSCPQVFFSNRLSVNWCMAYRLSVVKNDICTFKLEPSVGVTQRVTLHCTDIPVQGSLTDQDCFS